jgi:peptidoglycan pentaglycine glycine transferase (the first glycine)
VLAASGRLNGGQPSGRGDKEVKLRGLEWESVEDKERWNGAVAALPNAHVLQSYEWSEFKGRHGWRPFRLLLVRDGEPLAAASALLRRLPRAPWGVMYVPKGPVLEYGDLESLTVVLAELERLAGERRAVFVKIDPDVRADRSDVRKLLEGRGWRASAEQIQFRNTMVIDLRRSEEELLSAMKGKWRYNVRLARRKGVEVYQGGRDDLPLLYEMYTTTSARDEFIIRPFSYYVDAWGTFLSEGLAQLLLARHEGEVLAGLMLFRFADKAWYMYGASSDRHRQLMPNHLLQWEAMRWAKAQGCTSYDLWGAPEMLDENDPMWGVFRFKEGFGGEFTSYLGSFDFPVSRPLYWLYTVAMPKLLDLMRWRHRRRARGGAFGEAPGYG